MICRLGFHCEHDLPGQARLLSSLVLSIRTARKEERGQHASGHDSMPSKAWHTLPLQGIHASPTSCVPGFAQKYCKWAAHSPPGSTFPSPTRGEAVGG